jgi:hypothetical protein
MAAFTEDPTVAIRFVAGVRALQRELKLDDDELVAGLLGVLTAVCDAHNLGIIDLLRVAQGRPHEPAS